MSQLYKPSLEECKELFKRTGDCKHNYKEYVIPYKTTTSVETCLVCAKTFSKQYLTQGEVVTIEILKCLDNGMSSKTEIYKTIYEKLDVPKATIRRVAKALRDDMVRKVAVLSEGM